LPQDDKAGKGGRFRPPSRRREFNSQASANLAPILIEIAELGVERRNLVDEPEWLVNNPSTPDDKA
jgi:hypothetical protein